MVQADHPVLTEMLELRVPVSADNPAMMLTNHMMQASKLRDAIKEMLRKRKVKRLKDFYLVVDFNVMPNDRDLSVVYGYNLRVFEMHANTHVTRKPVLSIWAETRDTLVNDENMLLLLMLYNS